MNNVSGGSESFWKWKRFLEAVQVLRDRECFGDGEEGFSRQRAFLGVAKVSEVIQNFWRHKLMLKGLLKIFGSREASWG